MGLPVFSAYGSSKEEAEQIAHRVACAMNRDTLRAAVLEAIKKFRAEVLGLSNASTEKLADFIMAGVENY